MSIPDLTLWLVSPDTGAETLCLGRDAAEALSVRLMGSPHVLSVSCEPVSRASEDHLWTVVEVDEDLPAMLFQLGTIMLTSTALVGSGAKQREGAVMLAARRAEHLARVDERARVAAGCTRSQWHALKRCASVRP